jgi:hypothetical protein
VRLLKPVFKKDKAQNDERHIACHPRWDKYNISQEAKIAGSALGGVVGMLWEAVDSTSHRNGNGGTESRRENQLNKQALKK